MMIALLGMRVLSQNNSIALALSLFEVHRIVITMTLIITVALVTIGGYIGLPPFRNGLSL
jgi:hypothetical protein